MTRKKALRWSARNFFALLILGTSTLFATDFHVSTSGNDINPGTIDLPWRSLSNAVVQVTPGDTVIAHAGTYNERLVPPTSGTDANYITLRANPGDEVVIDGTGLSVSGLTGLVELTNRSFIRLEGFVIRNFSSSTPGRVPVGILVQGASEGLEIVGNLIEKIASTASVDTNLLGRDAHGIAIYGTATNPISNLLIRGNELRDLTLGSSEAMVLNGNVTDFRVLENHVHHCDNIGIDAIGFENFGPTEALDQARFGLIAGNHVHHCTSATNVSYGGTTSAGGIYIDGGRDIVVERNHVHHCDIGVEVASEHLGKVTRAIDVRSNLLRENLLAGVFIGGYNEDTTGDAADCSITHNTLFNNDTLPAGGIFGQIHIQYRVKDSVIANNILHHTITKDSQYNAFIVQWNTTGTNLAIHHNLHFGINTPVWVLKDTWLEGWTAYESDSSSGPAELWGNPLFADPAALDFIPAIGPAIDSADPTLQVTGERDFPGHQRTHGAGPDRGAIERDAPAPTPTPLAFSREGSLVKVQWTGMNELLYDLQETSGFSHWLTVPGHDSLAADSQPFEYEREPEPNGPVFFRLLIH